MKKSLAALRQELGGALSAKTTRQAGILFGGNLVNALLSFVAVIIVSRHLGPAEFGLVGLFNGIMLTVVAITDLGLNTTAIALISRNRTDNAKRASAIMQAIVRIELIIGAVVLIAGLLGSPWLASLLGKSSHSSLVLLAMVAGAFASMAAYFGPFFIAHEQYIKNAIINGLSFAARTGSICLLLILGNLNLTTVLLAYTLVPVLFFCIGFWLTPRYDAQTSPSEKRAAYSELMTLGKWALLSYAAVGLASRLDILLLARFVPGDQLGAYYAALQLVSPLILLANALMNVFLSNFNRNPTASYIRSRLAETMRYMTLLTIGITMVCVFAGPILTLLFGTSYASAVAPFRYLAVGSVAYLMAAPSQAALYALKKAHAVTVINQAQLVLLALFLIVAVPRFGITGAAISVLAANAVAMIASLAATRKVLP